MGEELNRLGALEPMTVRDRMLSVCFVAHNAYRALTGLGQGHIGGVERQTAIMARWLAARGHQVSVLVWEQGPGMVREIDGIRLISICPSDAGLPVMRFVHPRASGLVRALRQADAEVYYHNCAEAFTGIVGLWARAHRRRFVYSVASDPDVDPALPTLKRWYERWLYRAGLKRADAILVQSARQQKTLAAGFGRSSLVLPMPCPGPGAESPVPGKPAGPMRVVWIGRMDPVKRLDWLLDIAERLHEVIFDVAVANLDGSEYAIALQKRAQALTNVRWLGPVPHADIAPLYQAAACLCCTSIIEGFPNTFIEAWSYARPVVTTFDPDGLVARLNLGLVAHNVNEMVQALRKLNQSPELWGQQSQTARSYYLENHQVEIAMPRFEKQFVDVCRPAQTIVPGAVPENGLNLVDDGQNRSLN
jgi:glycosyltransferase involved in cell wall biosynthesis